MTSHVGAASERVRASKYLVKVPEITAYFWIAKLLTTAMGEATSDYFVYHINPYAAVVLAFLVFVAALWLQFRAKRYVAWVYWFAVVMVAVFGTMVADVTHIVLGVPYAISTITFAIILAVVFLTWYRYERTLSIHTVYAGRRELFYWATVLATFALGTATGDMTAVTLHLGYFSSGLMFTVLFAIPLVGRRLFGFGEVFAFWFAYVMTRPLGASFADWFGMPQTVGGLGYGRGSVAFVLTFFIVVLVGYLAWTKLDVQTGSLGEGTRTGPDAGQRGELQEH